MAFCHTTLKKRIDFITIIYINIAILVIRSSIYCAFSNRETVLDL